MKTRIEQILVDIAPRTTFLQSLRNNTLSNEEAIADLVDNSFERDVNASRVSIDKKTNRLVIADNGSGMTGSALKEAMKLGPTHIASMNDLGLFGFGLKNASMSIGKKLTVITKHTEDMYYTAIYDLDVIVKSGIFSIPIYPSSYQEIKTFGELNSQSATGTVLIIEKMDRLETNRDADFKNRVIKHLGEIFRVFIANGKKIIVNGISIEYNDILKANYTVTETEINDQTYRFKYPGEKGKEFDLRIRIGLFPAVMEGEKGRHGISLANQGFYVLRNNRQLMRGTWFNMVAHHSKFNRIRAEIYFDGEQDDVFTINFEKNQLQPKQWFIDQLREHMLGIINGYVVRINQEKRNKEVNDGSKDLHRRIKDDIESKSNRISPLKAAIPLNVNEGEIGQQGLNNLASLNIYTTEKGYNKKELVDFTVENISSSYICRFEDQGNGALRIVWNVNHPFYPFYLSEDIQTQAAFSKLLFSLGRAITKLGNLTAEYEKTMDDLQIQIGEEFRKLMD
jgi:hypothetical protein